MDFRTTIEIEKGKIRIDHTRKGMMLGSCFTEYMGRRMRDMKLPLCVNPYGILFNPLSIAATLEELHAGKRYAENDLIRSGAMWVSLRHHGSFSAPDPRQALERINRAASEGTRALRDADYAILTLGTAWVYEHKASGTIVSNCHKLPAREFTRRRLAPEEIVSALGKVLKGCLRDKEVILTVSPIRHLADGAQENQLSKSTLILAVHELAGQYANCRYFPAYEIMMDDLRDYRFYEQDMTHPAPIAQEYIWQAFCRYAIAPETQALFRKIADLQKALAHRPFNPDTEAHRHFLQKTLARTEAISGEFPSLDLSDEISELKSRLHL